jgi:hypothetical protein
MTGAASAVFLLDMKGRVLVWRDYRGDVTSAQAERFFSKLMDGEVSRVSHFYNFWAQLHRLLASGVLLNVGLEVGCKYSF